MVQKEGNDWLSEGYLMLDTLTLDILTNIKVGSKWASEHKIKLKEINGLRPSSKKFQLWH